MEGMKKLTKELQSVKDENEVLKTEQRQLIEELKKVKSEVQFERKAKTVQLKGEPNKEKEELLAAIQELSLLILSKVLHTNTQ